MMVNTDSFQNAADMLSSRADTIENDINIQIVLLIAILALMVISVGYLVVSKLLRWKKILIEKKKHHYNHNSTEKSDVEKFIKILPNLSKELQRLQSYKSKADDFDNLKNNFEKEKEENKKLSDQKANLEKEKLNFQQNLVAKDKVVADKLKEIEDKNKANKEILGKIERADILLDYAANVTDYLDFIESILKSTNEIINKTDPETAKIMSVLLQQAFQKTTLMAKWKQLCSDIIENGIAIQNKDLKNCFQSDKEPERLNAFKKLLISKMKPFTNAVLILCEANSNLSKFPESIDVLSIENEFKNKIAEIKNRAKVIGITEIVEVKLFTHLGNKEAIDGTISFPYSVVKNLNKDDITEIIEFGMKTEFEELTKSKVLIN
jgi:hypothetical protein